MRHLQHHSCVEIQAVRRARLLEGLQAQLSDLMFLTYSMNGTKLVTIKAVQEHPDQP